MNTAGQRVCVLGLGASGRAAVELLLAKGAQVTAIDAADNASLRDWADSAGQAAELRLGESGLIEERFDLCVVSPGIAVTHPQVVALQAAGIPVWSELELGSRAVDCPAIGITGTNGKTTTTELVAAILNANNRSTIAAGNIGTPLSAVARQSSQLDWVTLEVSSFQLETNDLFKPRIGVLLNLAPDHLDRHGTMDDYIRAKSRLFENQTPSDFALIQWEAWQELKRLGVKLNAQCITFSATVSEADWYLDGGQLVSQLPDSTEPWPDFSRCELSNQPNPENILAALLVGHCVGLAMKDLMPPLLAYQPGPHRCELVGEVGGVRFYNDSKATNVHALCSALRALPADAERKNVWLIAGGMGKGLDFSTAQMELERRVKGVMLIGESALKIQSIWGGFVPCQIIDNLIQAVAEAGRNAVPGDVVLLSPACASFDMFDSYQHRGEAFREAFAEWQRAHGPGD